MKKRALPLGCQIFLGIFVSIILGLIGYFLYLNHWYNQVQAKLPEVQQKLVDINYETLEQFPPPPGLSEIEQEEHRYHYSIVFSVSYRITDPNLDVLDYYSTFLDNAGWTRDIANSIENENLSYFKDTTCISVYVYSKESNLRVYTDFEKQDFSPKLPPFWYRMLRGEWDPYITPCPLENAKTR